MEFGKKVNINIQGNEDTQVDVRIVLDKSVQYKDLLDQLKTQEKLFALIPETEIEERLAISKKVNDLKDLIEQFKRDVLQLAQGFQSVEINTDRLKRAKAFFDKGEFGEARAVFEMELEEMQDNHTRLLEEKKKFETNTLPKLRHNAEEFYILALSTSADYTNPSRFADTCCYFELSIESEATKDNLFHYAHFLADHNQFPKAVNYYNQYLNKFVDELSLKDKAGILNNLAILYRNLNEYEKASKEFTKALEIYQNLVKENSQDYLSYVARTLNSLAILHRRQNQYEKALKEYEEALKIYRNLAKNNPQDYLSYVATILSNLAGLHWKQDRYEMALKEIEEALKIRRNLAKDNPQIYLPDVAATLNNLAILHDDQIEYEKALQEYEEALEIYRNLAKDNPQAYLPDIALTLNNLSILYQNQKEYKKASLGYEEALEIRRNLYEQMPNVYAPDLANTLKNFAIFYQAYLPEREKSLKYIMESVILLLPIVEVVPFTQSYMQNALAVLRGWNLSDEEIERLIQEKMKETGENQA